MRQAARRLESRDVAQELAAVVGVVGHEVRVRTTRGEETARRAVSCLVAPAPNDEVLLAGLPDGRLFVLAVLERTDRDRTEIAVPGALELRAEESVSITSTRLALRAAEGRVVFGSLTALLGSLLTQVEAARLVADTIDSVCQRLSQTLRRCTRRVTEMDELRAGRLDYRTEQEMCLRAENLLAGARKLAKVDGEQIHIG